MHQIAQPIEGAEFFGQFVEQPFALKIKGHFRRAGYIKRWTADAEAATVFAFLRDHDAARQRRRSAQQQNMFVGYETTYNRYDHGKV